MSPSEVVNAPPAVSTFVPYPIAIGVFLAVLLTSTLLYVGGKFDTTGGPLTISILIVLGMLGACAYCLIFTVPQDDITPGVVGGLTAGFGAVIAYWFGRAQAGRNPPVQPPEPPRRGPDGE
jgi:hypothetical protein